MREAKLSVDEFYCLLEIIGEAAQRVGAPKGEVWRLSLWCDGQEVGTIERCIGARIGEGCVAPDYIAHVYTKGLEADQMAMGHPKHATFIHWWAGQVAYGYLRCLAARDLRDAMVKYAEHFGVGYVVPETLRPVVSSHLRGIGEWPDDYATKR